LISDVDEHKQQDILNKGACRFNHIIGLPKKIGQEQLFSSDAYKYF
jgi:hypothetical protein